MLDPAAITTFVANHAWQSGLLVAVLWGVLTYGRRLSASARHALAFATLAAAAALPLAAFLPGSGLATVRPLTASPTTETVTPGPVIVTLPAGRTYAAAERRVLIVPAPPEAVAPSAKEAAFIRGETFRPAVGSAPRAEPDGASAVGARGAAWSFPVRTLGLAAGVVWAIGAALLLFRIGRHAVAAERLRLRAAPVELPTTLPADLRRLAVRESADVHGPMVVGLLRPTVLLPEGALAGYGHSELRGLLEHERAHVARGDVTLALLQRVLIALLWWSPAMHWLGRRIDDEREMACDEAAARQVGDARAFALTLTTHAQARLAGAGPHLAVGAVQSRSQLGRRVRRLIERAGAAGASHARAIGRLCAATLAAVVVAAALATPRLDAQVAGEEDAVTAPPAPPRAPSPPRPSSAPDAPPAPDASRAEAAAEWRAAAEARRQEIAEALREQSAARVEAQAALQAAVRAFAAAQEEFQRERRTLTDEDIAEREAEIDALQAELDAAADAFGDAMSALADVMPELDFAFDFDVDGAVAHAFAGADWSALVDLSDHAEVMVIDPENAEQWAEFGRRWGDWGRTWGQAWGQGWTEAWNGGRRSPLVSAIRQGDQEMVRMLVEAGADVNADGGASLLAAVHTGEADIVRALIDLGADANAAPPGSPPALLVAARAGEPQVVAALLEGGADPNAESAWGETPLLAAVHGGESEIVQMLIDAGADVNPAPPETETETETGAGTEADE